MPYLTPRTKRAKDNFRFKALQNSKSLAEFGHKVANIGSKGGIDPDKSATETGRQILSNMAIDLLTKLDQGQVKFSEEVVGVLKGAVKGELDEKKFDQMKWATEQGLKVGVLGGYAPEKRDTRNINVEIQISDKVAKIKLKAEEELLKELEEV